MIQLVIEGIFCLFANSIQFSSDTAHTVLYIYIYIYIYSNERKKKKKNKSTKDNISAYS